MSLSYVPYITSICGGCLTAENWANVGIETVACSLQALLTRPGYEFLKELLSLKKYFGWSGKLIVDGRLPHKLTPAIYTWTSPYDGKKIQFSADKCLALINCLEFDFLILPENIQTTSSEVINTDKQILSNLADCRALKNVLPFLTADCINESFWNPVESSLSSEKAGYWITDFPAEQALLGCVYSADGLIDLSAAEMAEQFSPIAPDCTCPTCMLGATRAYLHYLLQSTPLLCHRLLIQHNAYNFQKRIATIS
ncbi:MAG: hypothetical protein H2069_03965 [Legionella sp.]|nr:hypothetical protein [Legionella sp.]